MSIVDTIIFSGIVITFFSLVCICSCLNRKNILSLSFGPDEFGDLTVGIVFDCVKILVILIISIFWYGIIPFIIILTLVGLMVKSIRLCKDDAIEWVANCLKEEEIRTREVKYDR